jgi:hypothetical protein
VDACLDFVAVPWLFSWARTYLVRFLFGFLRTEEGGGELWNVVCDSGSLLFGKVVIYIGFHF